MTDLQIKVTFELLDRIMIWLLIIALLALIFYDSGKGDSDFRWACQKVCESKNMTLENYDPFYIHCYRAEGNIIHRESWQWQDYKG